MSHGIVWKYGDNVNTDVIFPGRYTYQIMPPEEMAQHAMEDLDPGFAAKVKPGDVVVAGKNFGCGSSREQAAACLKAAGVQAVVAKSFARIYFRNAINLGLAVLQSDEAVDRLETGDHVDIDLARGEIRSAKGTFRFAAPPGVRHRHHRGRRPDRIHQNRLKELEIEENRSDHAQVQDRHSPRGRGGEGRRRSDDDRPRQDRPRRRLRRTATSAGISGAKKGTRCPTGP